MQIVPFYHSTLFNISSIIYVIIFIIYWSLSHLQVLDVQGWWQGLLQLLGLRSVVNNQGVLVSGTSDLELGLLELLTVGVDLLVDLDNSRLDVSSSSQFDEFLDIFDFLL